MSPVLEVTYYRAECDGCGLDFQEASDYSAWAERGAALDGVNDEGGIYAWNAGGPATELERLEVLLCSSCVAAFRAELEAEQGEDGAETYLEFLEDNVRPHVIGALGFARLRAASKPTD